MRVVPFVNCKFPIVNCVAAALVLTGGGAATASSQPSANVDPVPIQCWWRTSAPAVRVGEPFSFVLTCAVFETDALKVVPDQSRLDPSVVQMAPFEVLGGSHGPDLRAGDRRLFQYEYRLRLVGEDLFGKDVKLPEIHVGYRVQSRVAQGAANEGRDRTYTLPPESIRVLSMVPGDAASIRDQSAETFIDLDERGFRASAMRITAGILLTLGAIAALLALAKLADRYRRQSPDAGRLVADRAVLRAVDRELAAVERAREQAGWTPELAARALSALRITAGYGADRPVSQSAATPATAGADGFLAVPIGWTARSSVLVSGSMTAARVADARKRASAAGAGARRIVILETLEEALLRLTQAQYGRDASISDAAALDESVAAARRVLSTLARQHTWLAKRLAAFTRATSLP